MVYDDSSSHNLLLLIIAANVGENCINGNADCTVADSECSSGTCKCIDTTHYNTSATSCIQKGGFGEVCDTAIGDGTCLYSLRCIVNECQCEKPAIQFFSENICKYKIVLAALCTPGPTDQCLDANAECKKDTDIIDKCLCKTNYKISNDACVASM
ncbi:unnamed protein product [Mytilus coruscus]|uniref:EB domain-containing protein n=1 Tax=Mytilus coruscus TaxID=42192 RepID=A0A6J8DWZ3_MYTCO|nr:unnamed protein product [Mytilus coruscus]